MTTYATRTQTTDDAALLQRITSYNDYRAFETLFHRYYNTLCQRAFLLVQAREISEEIVSDVFLKIWKNREVIHIESSVKGYLITATRNLSIDFLRRQTRQRGRAMELVGDFESNYAAPSELLIGKETQYIIESAIDSLSPQCRLIFRMSRDNSMTYPEIAKSLNLSIKTIETHMGRALKSLRSSLGEQGCLVR